MSTEELLVTKKQTTDAEEREDNVKKAPYIAGMQVTQLNITLVVEEAKLCESKDKEQAQNEVVAVLESKVSELQEDNKILGKKNVIKRLLGISQRALILSGLHIRVSR